jgi:hypothetical protein
MNKPIAFEPILASVDQAAAMIGRGRSFIYECLADGRLKAVKSNKRTLIVVESLRDYAAGLSPAKIEPMAPRRRRANALKTWRRIGEAAEQVVDRVAPKDGAVR